MEPRKRAIGLGLLALAATAYGELSAVNGGGCCCFVVGRACETPAHIPPNRKEMRERERQ